MEMNKKIGVVGFGEVGKAVASFYEDPFIEDPALGMEIPNGIEVDVLHICIPHRNQLDFISAATRAIEAHGPRALVFIHSTVAVGTTEVIARTYPNIVHSPVRGVHPHLAEGIKTFPKYVGADHPEAGRAAFEHLEEIGIHPVLMDKSATTELLKLLDTTYYGLAIAYHAYAERLCAELGVSFDMVMTEANRSYNQGYTELGKTNVVRPVLFPPVGGVIGGHCVIPNAEILRDHFGDDAILQAILRHK